jgi:hypothetical protein
MGAIAREVVKKAQCEADWVGLRWLADGFRSDPKGYWEHMASDLLARGDDMHVAALRMVLVAVMADYGVKGPGPRSVLAAALREATQHAREFLADHDAVRWPEAHAKLTAELARYEAALVNAGADP